MVADDSYPFAGLRVLDFGIGAVGVEAGRLFAEYGADVIKVESATYPDFIRVVAGTNMNPQFASSSRSKRSLGVNLKEPRGLEIVRKLVELADVLIENSATGAMERMGLGYDAVSGINPRIVVLSSQLMGSTGAWRDWTGYGPNTRPVAGLTYLWNHPEDADDPVGVSTIHPDHFAGRLAALLGVAALIRRERTGRGGHGDVAQFEAIVGMLGDLLVQESMAPGSVRPRGNGNADHAPWGPFPCQGEDEWCAINVREDEEWRSLRTVMGDPAWSRDPELDRAAGRVGRRAELDELLAGWTRQWAPHALMTELQRHGIPAGVLQHPGHQLEDPHLRARGFLRPVEQPPLGRLVLEGPAFLMSAIPEPIVGPAPDLGEHTRAICAELLGMPDEEIDTLIGQGVLEEPSAAQS